MMKKPPASTTHCWPSVKVCSGASLMTTNAVPLTTSIISFVERSNLKVLGKMTPTDLRVLSASVTVWDMHFPSKWIFAVLPTETFSKLILSCSDWMRLRACFLLNVESTDCLLVRYCDNVYSKYTSCLKYLSLRVIVSLLYGTYVHTHTRTAYAIYAFMLQNPYLQLTWTFNDIGTLYR